LENLQLAKSAIQKYGLNQKVAGIHNQMMQELGTPVRHISQRRRLVRYGMTIAARVAIVVIANFVFNSTTVTSGKLFEENYFSYELSTTRDPAAIETPIEKAYKGKDYQEVAKAGDTATTVKSLFLAAMSNLESKNDAKAIELFKTVIAKTESAGTGIFKDESEYYLALTYLRSKEYDRALELMQKIRDDKSHLYHEKITDKLVRDIRKLR